MGKNTIRDFNGIILYDIELNGCLNGVYTNMGAGCEGVIYNEIARKKNSKEKAVAGIEEDIDGDYDCQFFDAGANPYRDCELTITKDVGMNAYSFEWTDTSGKIFTGRGYKMNKRQIAVHYW